MSALAALPERLSPVHELVAHRRGNWGTEAGMPVARHFGDLAGERARANDLALADASALPRLTLKGPGAVAYLEERGIAVPGEIFGVAVLSNGGLVARTGVAEVFVEDGAGERRVQGLERALGGAEARAAGAYAAVRQDASFLIAGSRAHLVMAQTCGVDFSQHEAAAAAGGRLVFTRVAGVSCSIWPRIVNGYPVVQLWLDASYGAYLWEQLEGIVEELGGGLAGWEVFFPRAAESGAEQ